MNETSGEPGGLDRRELLRKAALIGGTLWVVPAVQSLNVRAAHASAGSPMENCYSIRVGNGKCDSSNFACLQHPTGVAGGCQQDITVHTNGPNGSWVVTLPQGCHFVEGFSRCGRRGLCAPATVQGNVGTFPRCTRRSAGSGPLHFDVISHIEFTFCCPTPRRPATTPSG
jgi:hypothetical protein